MLDGFNIPVSYGRLREACQTDVDGTSIDTMEDVACQLGLQAEQNVVPPDHILRDEAHCLPAIAVTSLPNGLTHFIVVWRRWGQWVQIMDPGEGRQWVKAQHILSKLYHHTMPVGAEDWYEWASSDEFIEPLRGRLRELKLTEAICDKLLEQATQGSSWFPLAALDAAARMVTSLVEAGGIPKGHPAGQLLTELWLEARGEESIALATLEVNPHDRDATSLPLAGIPRSYWSVWPAPEDPEEGDQVYLRGGVIVRALGLREDFSDEDEGEERDELSPELVAALEEPTTHPAKTLLQMLREDGLLGPGLLLLMLIISTLGVMLETLLFRGFFELGTLLALPEQRLLAHLGIVAFVFLMLAIEYPLITGIVRMGRHLETKLRLAFLQKIPRLQDRYFQSRLRSDMAERSHSVQLLRILPQLGSSWLRAVFTLVLTTTGIIWLAPSSATLTLFVAAVSFVVPLTLQPLLFERDMRTRTHAGALSRFYLDAMLGLFAVRAHGAEKAVKREHESMLVDWANSGLGLQRMVVGLEGVQSVISIGLVGLLLFHHLSQGGQPASILLLVYWSLQLPALGQQLAGLTRQYPAMRNVTLRLLEPLGAPEAEQLGETDVTEKSEHPQSVSLALHDVQVQVSGHLILDGLNLEVKAGEHVAIVGSSGAGKSSFVGLLLGWYRTTQGSLLVDNQPLTGARLERLRRETAWVDPDVHIWNQTFLENLLYGNSAAAKGNIGTVLEQATLHNVLEILPDGLQTSLGEGGALLSGGQGQRVRLGRAMLRHEPKLVILDEPFRGLDRNKRLQLLHGARDYWHQQTMLCITHDVGDTLHFPRVLVIEDGQIVEDDNPQVLAEQVGSRYHTLLQAEHQLRRGLWQHADWRTIWIHQGKLSEQTPNQEEAS